MVLYSARCKQEYTPFMHGWGGGGGRAGTKFTE